MAMLDYVPLNSFSGSFKSGTGSGDVEITPGPTIDEILIEYNYSATAGDEFDPTHFSAIKLNLNTEDIIDVKGSDLEMVELYKMGNNDNGYLVIPLAEIVAKTFDGMNAFGLVTLPGDALSLSFELAGARAASADASVKAWARYSPGRAKRVVVPKMRTLNFSNDVTGIKQINSLPRGVNYKRLHIGGGNVTELEVKKGRVSRFKMTKARNDFILKRHGRTPQAGYYHFDPVADGYMLAHTMGTDVREELELLANMSGTGSAPILAEFVEQVGQPGV